MHGLIFATSIWLLAGSTRYSFITALDVNVQSRQLSPLKSGSKKTPSFLHASSLSFAIDFSITHQIPTPSYSKQGKAEGKGTTESKSPMTERQLATDSPFGWLNRQSSALVALDFTRLSTRYTVSNENSSLNANVKQIRSQQNNNSSIPDTTAKMYVFADIERQSSHISLCT